MKQNLLFVGPIHSRSGYGNHARDLLDSLIEMDFHNIKVMPIPWGATPNNEALELYSHLLYKGEQIPFSVSVQVTVPNEFRKLTPFDIGVTAGIETTAASMKWMEGLNKVDLVIVPSEFSRDVFLSTKYVNKKDNSELKLEKPIEVLFEGVKSFYEEKQIENQNIKHSLNSISEDFLFLFVGHWLSGNLGEDRKNVGLMIKIFLETFKNTPSTLMPALVLKTGTNFSHPELDSIQNKIEAIISSVKRYAKPEDKFPNIYILAAHFTDEEMNELYNHTKIKSMISFTKGEGFGRPLLEFSTTGKPIIASEWSGHLDFLPKELAVLVPGKLKNVHQSAAWENVIIPQSSWFNVNPPMAASALMTVFKNYKKFKQNAVILAKQNKEQFSFDAMKVKFEEIIKKYVPIKKEIKLPKLDKIKLPQLKKVEE